MVSTGIATNVPLSGNSGKSAAAVKGYVLPPGQSPRGHYSLASPATISMPWDSACALGGS